MGTTGIEVGGVFPDSPAQRILAKEEHGEVPSRTTTTRYRHRKTMMGAWMPWGSLRFLRMERTHVYYGIDTELESLIRVGPETRESTFVAELSLGGGRGERQSGDQAVSFGGPTNARGAVEPAARSGTRCQTSWIRSRRFGCGTRIARGTLGA